MSRGFCPGLVAPLWLLLAGLFFLLLLGSVFSFSLVSIQKPIFDELDADEFDLAVSSSGSVAFGVEKNSLMANKKYVVLKPKVSNESDLAESAGASVPKRNELSKSVVGVSVAKTDSSKNVVPVVESDVARSVKSPVTGVFIESSVSNSGSDSNPLANSSNPVLDVLSPVEVDSSLNGEAVVEADLGSEVLNEENEVVDVSSRSQIGLHDPDPPISDRSRIVNRTNTPPTGYPSGLRTVPNNSGIKALSSGEAQRRMMESVSISTADNTYKHNTGSCSDSDNGIFSRYAGSVTLKSMLAGDDTVKDDECVSLGSGKFGVKEYYCNYDSVVMEKIIPCDEGCVNGECVLLVEPIPTRKEVKKVRVAFSDETEFGDSGTCLDSDGGVFSKIRGAVEVEALDIITGEAKKVVKSDYCLSSSTLIENYCENDLSGFRQFGIQEISCENGCYNGVCLNYPSLCELDPTVLRYQLTSSGIRPMGAALMGGSAVVEDEPFFEVSPENNLTYGDLESEDFVEDVPAYPVVRSGRSGIGLHGGPPATDPPALGDHNIAILLAKAPGTTMPPLPDLEQIMEKVREYYLDISYGQTRINWQVFGPYDLPTKGNYMAVPAVDRDIDFTKFQHIAIIDSRNTQATASITYVWNESNEGWTLIGKMNFPASFFNVGTANNKLVGKASAFAHELGHNFGVRHADSLYCGDKYVAPFEECRVYEYGDRFDVMGISTNSFSVIPNMNALFKWKAGFIDDSRVTLVNSKGVYDIAPLVSDNGVILLKVLKKNGLPGNDEDYYYLEYKIPQGRDEEILNYLGTPFGVYIRAMKGNNGLLTNDSLLIDMDSTRDIQGGLQLGMLFVDPMTGLRMMPVSVNESKVKVKIEYC